MRGVHSTRVVSGTLETPMKGAVGHECSPSLTNVIPGIIFAKSSHCLLHQSGGSEKETVFLTANKKTKIKSLHQVIDAEGKDIE